MKTVKTFFLLVAMALLGCSSQEQPPLKIVANSWIGYSPLFYAKANGWLEPLNIKLSTVVSLGESMHIYEYSGLDAFTGTQYEYHQVHQKNPNLIPVIMFDRSNGGDVVMSNRSEKSLRETADPINVYLEINSVNQLVFKDFVKRHKLQDKTFNYINGDQLKIVSELKNNLDPGPSIVVTYVPYNHSLEKSGFTTLASTRDGLDLLVLDALYTTKDTFKLHNEQFKQLKSLIDRAIYDLKNHPKQFYERVKPYLENNTYDEFLSSLEDIVWLNNELDPKLVERLDEALFPTRDLL